MVKNQVRILFFMQEKEDLIESDYDEVLNAISMEVIKIGSIAAVKFHKLFYEQNKKNTDNDAAMTGAGWSRGLKDKVRIIV